MDDTQKQDEQLQEETQDDSLQQLVTKLQQDSEQLENQLKRSLADYQNLQRRVQEEKAHWIRIANKELLLQLLPVLDTLNLAHKHNGEKGIELSIHQFEQVLELEGVVKIKTLEQDFDPTMMEVVSTKEEEKKEGKVIEEVRAGYLYHDQVLRIAQVIVGK